MDRTEKVLIRAGAFGLGITMLVCTYLDVKEFYHAVKSAGPACMRSQEGTSLYWPFIDENHSLINKGILIDGKLPPAIVECFERDNFGKEKPSRVLISSRNDGFYDELYTDPESPCARCHKQAEFRAQPLSKRPYEI